MPGIAGIIGTAAACDRTAMTKSMVRRMLHESWHGSGTAHFDTVGCSAGWVCHQGSFADCQPVWNVSRDVCLIFSGECFGEIQSEAGSLLCLYEEFGLSFLEKLNGWFSGVLLDLRQNKVFLFNDRYGLNRIYWHRSDDGFYFASEAKALLGVLPELRELYLKGLAEQFACGCVLQNRTLFRGISLLPGGSVWTFSPDGQVKKASYFTPETWENQLPLEAEDYQAALKEAFPRILSRYLCAGQKIGMSLTGGLDGRMIMACAPQPPGMLPCYTFGGMYRDCADVKIGREVARLCRQPHGVIRVGEEFLGEFPALAAKAVHVSDGTMDVSGAVELHVNRLAREIAPVRLTGNYGSEILRGNVAFRPGLGEERLFTPEFSRLRQEAANTYATESRGHRLSFIAFKQVPWHHYGRLSIEQSQVTMRSPFLDNELVRLAYQAPAEGIASALPTLRVIADGNRLLAGMPTDRGLVFPLKPLATRARRFWQENTAKAEYAWDYGMPPWLARMDRAVAPLHLERLFLGRHKFYHFRVWYRDQLAPFVRETLLDPLSLSRPYLRRKAVEQMVEEHTSGRRNHTLGITKLLTAELIQRRFVEAPSEDPEQRRAASEIQLAQAAG
jgi:asparagine synthase (glutamine-hydrolysing)